MTSERHRGQSERARQGTVAAQSVVLAVLLVAWMRNDHAGDASPRDPSRASIGDTAAPAAAPVAAARAAPAPPIAARPFVEGPLEEIPLDPEDPVALILFGDFRSADGRALHEFLVRLYDEGGHVAAEARQHYERGRGYPSSG